MLLRNPAFASSFSCSTARIKSVRNGLSIVVVLYLTGCTQLPGLNKSNSQFGWPDWWVGLSGPERILDGKVPINVDRGHAAPAVFDFDNDGKKDLLVGQFGEGKLRFYRNLGSNRRPRFKGFSYVTVNGMQISVPFG